MASTKLLRKARRNKGRAKVKQDTIKRLSFQPVIKKVDPEELKKEFAPAKKTAKKEAPKKEEAATEAAE